ncbi:AraC-type DNA-binding protein [Caldanaerobius fijiensis DSM 17918]|uniref:AraC-type DNA-binding protein n=1 Tax=Caldanaerobius fijiensis DSM 17918 TaxID=1121256 RepID=A0A1M4YK81_9THEO|nr:AraC family transcriptional regulator [Caldanaerobius fijiensis]SHF06159.1 AraC-type DNA-binding protein [Caldanaerobius fijiensis DSM 17918]
MKKVPEYYDLLPGYSFNFLVSLDYINNRFPMHRHNFFEIYVVISGHGKEVINGKEYYLQRGSLTFLLPWHIHEIFADPEEPLRLIRCNFGMEVVMEDINSHGGMAEIVYKHVYSDPSIQLPPDIAEQVITIFEGLLEEFRGDKPWKEILIKAKIIEVLVYFNRFRNKGSNPELPEEYRIVENSDISNLLPYIHFHCNQDITLSDLAEKFHCSETKLNEYLYSHTGLSFTDYLNEVRIRLACALLSNPELKISEISKIVGYKSMKTFYRAFKSLKGFSPEEFRQYYFTEEGRKEPFPFPSPLMWKIIHYIQLHYSEDLTLSDVAKKFHYSESSLSELCKRQTGQSFIDMLHEIRVFHACSLLLSTDMSVTDIGFEVGFNSSETFFRVFKKLKGVSPEKYRQKAKIFTEKINTNKYNCLSQA